MTQVKQPVMRYHGGKFRMADWIIGFFPHHRVYVEPFGGAASILMRKPRSYGEVYNDMDDEIVNVFRCLRDHELCRQLAEQLTLTPYSRTEFEGAFNSEADLEPIERARRTIFRAQAGFGSAGATQGSTGFRIDSAREYGLSSHLWVEYPSALQSFCDRMLGVIIENRPAISVMQQHDTPETLHYVDPPYMWESRFSRKGDGDLCRRSCYRHEMTVEDHQELLSLLLELEGFVIVSGYMTDLYREVLEGAGWTLETKIAQISAHRGTKSKTECIWMNPKCAEHQNQRRLI